VGITHKYELFLRRAAISQISLAKSLYRFILNGLLHANEILGEQIFRPEEWKVIGEYVYDGEGGRHQAFYSPLQDVYYKDVHFKTGERIQVEQSLKYSAEEASQLWERSGLNEVGRWSALSDAYSKWSCRSLSLLFRNYRAPWEGGG
jgi:uncharacterized SAM-dependent methyltransferase